MDYKEAVVIQKEMAQRVVTQDCIPKQINLVAGMDVSNSRFDPAKMIYAAGVLLSFADMQVQNVIHASLRQEFPYIPGLLGFREAPALQQVSAQLKILPDLIFVDGHGISHPRRLGVASHLGVLLDIPTVGVAKTILVGEAKGDLGETIGSTIPLIWKGEKIGVLLRTKKRCAPLIISTGHKVSLETAIQLVLDCNRGYRLPEPTRHAHLAANECRRKLTIRSK
jgi:deoxyribonuclease V